MIKNNKFLRNQSYKLKILYDQTFKTTPERGTFKAGTEFQWIFLHI